MGAHAERMRLLNGTNRSRKSHSMGVDVMINARVLPVVQDNIPDYDAIAAFNKDAQAWGMMVKSELMNELDMELNDGTELKSSLHDYYWPSANQSKESIERISYKFKRYGVFVHKGVGRGYEMQGDNVVKYSTKSNTFARHPKPWFNPTIEQYLPQLATIVEAYCEGIIINSVRILIR